MLEDPEIIEAFFEGPHKPDAHTTSTSSSSAIPVLALSNSSPTLPNTTTITSKSEFSLSAPSIPVHNSDNNQPQGDDNNPATSNTDSGDSTVMATSHSSSTLPEDFVFPVNFLDWYYLDERKTKRDEIELRIAKLLSPV